ncbi:MAG TPA: hypothetical protein VE715_02555 [Blastocatellia bacterium]|nr:hypothetical protein [Blastocatellia bacterium]
MSEVTFEQVLSQVKALPPEDAACAVKKPTMRQWRLDILTLSCFLSNPKMIVHS